MSVACTILASWRLARLSDSSYNLTAMSTKNLARTVIEGGRRGLYKVRVEECASIERTAERSYLRLITRDHEAADDCVAPKRLPVSPIFADKLSPVYAYLDSRVGKNWNKTFADVSAKFDLRTTPGRHVTNDHMLAVIAFNGEHKLVTRDGHSRYFRYFVDKQGILRKNVQRVRVHNSPPKPFDSARLVSWLGNRKVGQQGARFVWWVPVEKEARVRAVWDTFGLKYVNLDVQGAVIMIENLRRSGFGWEPRFVSSVFDGPYRAAGLLKGDDETYFLSLPDRVRKSVLQAAPSHGGPHGVIVHAR